jgi:hypothetical protein
VTRARLAAAALFVIAVAAGVYKASAQVPPLPIPLPTTTTAPPPTTPTTEAPTTTSTPTTELEEITDTTLPVEAPPETAPLPEATSTTEPRARLAPLVPNTVLPAGLRPASVTGAYGLGVGAVIAAALLLVVFTTIARSQLVPGGSPMNARRRARLIAGFACLALAAIVGLVGYLKLSLETDVNRQIPYMASAGMALVLLAAAGGAFIVGEQMRTDEKRIDELEAAVQQLAAMVAPTVEAPARTRSRRSPKG